MVDPTLFHSRHDSTDPRLGDLISKQNQDSAHWMIAGYPDDEGVQLNGGRVGAAQGPDEIRRFLYKMTPSPFLKSESTVAVHDLGNLNVKKMNLAERHEAARVHALKTMREGKRWLALGGGHDYAYADVSAFLDFCHEKKQRGLLLNFDAHLDVRETTQGFHSGTGFRRVLEQNYEFDFYEIGIQSQCNSRSHIQWSKDHGVQLITWDELEWASPEGLGTFILNKLEAHLVRRGPVFLSVDLDAFALPFSAGTSAPSATGFTAQSFLPLWEVLRSRLDVRGAGFYEHSPLHDPERNTARLAALLVHRLIACDPTA